MRRSPYFRAVFWIFLACSSALHADVNDLVINELSASYHTEQDPSGDYDDWLEIYNAGDTSVRLRGLYLTDDLTEPTLFELPDETLEAGDHAVFWLDNEPDEGDDHAPFALNDTGEEVFLTRLLSNGEVVIVDSISYDDMRQRASFGRQTDGSGVLIPFGIATLGRSNRADNEWLPAPVFSVSGGAYRSPRSVTLSSPVPATTIRYTTDGSEPTSTSRRYDGSIGVDRTMSIRAACFKSGFAPSRTATQSYLIDEDLELPVFYVSIDPEFLWDDEIGIYVEGVNGKTGNCSTEPRNWNQDWEYPGHVTFLEPDGEVGFAQDAGISITGGCTRRKPQKSLKISSSSRYGYKEIDYRFFPGDDQDEFRDIKLRNSGNDWSQTMMRDALLHVLGDAGGDLEIQRYRPAVLFLNGEYWGIHNIRDVQNEDYLNAKFPEIDKDKVDIIAGYSNPKAREGNRDAYYALIDFMEGADLSDADDYAVAESLVDVSQFTDYYILQIFAGNHDWPANNLKLWRERTDGARWRWIVFDVDNGFGKNRSVGPETDTLSFALRDDGPSYPNPPEATLLLRRFMDNPEFRDEFIQRFATQLELLYDTDLVESVSNAMQGVIEEAIRDHIDRWGDEGGVPSYSSWSSECNRLRSYGRERADFMRQHIADYFDLSGTYRLTVAFDADSGGRVYVNSNQFAVPFNYTGSYFDDVPVMITAAPDPGFSFVEWQETGETEATIAFVADERSTLTPVFVPSGSGTPPASAASLVLSEIHYNPIDSDEFEFLEFHNTSSSTIDLSGVTITSGVDFEFPDGTTLLGGGYVVVVEDEADFLSRYSDPESPYYFDGIFMAGEWEGKLSNDGETIKIIAANGTTISSVSYDDEGDWAPEADDEGSSLELLVPFDLPTVREERDAYLADPFNWVASENTHGSPGRSGDEDPAPVDTPQTGFRLLSSATLLRDDASRALLFDASIEWNSEVEDATWEGLRFTANGAGNEAELLDTVSLFVDSNSNGTFDSGDRQLGETLRVAVDNAKVDFRFGTDAPVLRRGEAERFFLVAKRSESSLQAGAAIWPLLFAGRFWGWLALSAACLVLVAAARSRTVSRPCYAPLASAALIAFALVIPVACGGGGGGGGGGDPVDTPLPGDDDEPVPTPQGALVRFDIVSPDDVLIRGVDSRANSEVLNLPLKGTSLRI